MLYRAETIITHNKVYKSFLRYVNIKTVTDNGFFHYQMLKKCQQIFHFGDYYSRILSTGLYTI
jgi:hypothetical protein